jgi:hypothetical protein
MLWKLPKALNVACARTFGHGNKMAPVCSIIPEYLLEIIIERGNAPDDIVTECRSTLDRNNQLRTARSERGQQIASASQGVA